MDDRHRLDKWLWCARFYKSRALATEAVIGGKVKLNGERVKPAHAVKVGDRLDVTRAEVSITLFVRDLPDRRGAAAVAQSAYQETPESVTRRAHLQEQQRLAALASPARDQRPDKRERRLLDRLHRQQH
jgi:ribosome-associated heat shock protein Hsp15